MIAPARPVMDSPARLTDHDRIAQRDFDLAVGTVGAHFALAGDQRPRTVFFQTTDLVSAGHQREQKKQHHQY
jgi:hypothetical protein